MAGKTVLVRSDSRPVQSRAIEAGLKDLLVAKSPNGVGRVTVWQVSGDDVLRDGKKVGRYVRIRSREDEHLVRGLKGKVEVVIVDPQDWKVIPLENLVAALDGKTRLLAVAKDAAEARLFLGTLEKGVDGVVVSPRNAKEVAEVAALAAPAPPPLKLLPAKVTRIQQVGMGERVCVDTANMFEPGEGLLVGSTSHGFFLVSAECYESEYVAARPFRVNAGAVHSYVLVSDRTRYLSEIRSGAELEAVDAKGHRRPVVVGRAKIETRPLLLVEAEAEGGKASAILQNAETIRLVQPRGRVKSVAQLRVGDTVLIHAESGARHFGMKIEERIREV